MNKVIRQTSKQYNSIDIMKFICSILIICIHTLPLVSVNPLLDDILVGILSRIAVPLFFISSGFLFYNKIGEDELNNKIIFLNYLKRIIQLYVGWSLVYFILYMINGSIDFNTINLFKKIFITGIALQLWYFPALIFSISLMYIISKKVKINKVYIYLSIPLYLFGMLGTTYYSLLDKTPYIKDIMSRYINIFETTRNGLFFGFIFIIIGAYLSKEDNKINFKKDATILVISVVLLMVEAIFISKFTVNIYGRDMFIFLPLVAAYSFKIVLYINDKIKSRETIYKVLRNLSILIFGLHVGVMNVIRIDNSLINFLVITFITIVISMGIIILEKNKIFRSITKYLY